MKWSIIKYVKNNRGSMLAMILIFTVVLTILGTAILQISLANTRNVIRQESSLKAYFIAQSGANALAHHISTNSSADIAGMVNSGPTNPLNVIDGELTIDVTEVGDSLVISAVGEVREAEKEVKVIMEKSAGNLFDFTILADNVIDITNHVNVIGTVGTNATSGSVSTSPNASPQVADIKTEVGVVFPPIEIPLTYDQTETSTISNDFTLNVSGDTSVHLEQGVSLPTHGTFEVTGSGVLHLYISNGWSSANHSQFVSDPNVTVFVYVIDGSDVYIRSHVFRGIIYAPYSDVTFHNASGSAHGGRNFLGSIIANNVYLTGNHTTLEDDSETNGENMTIDFPYQIMEWQ